MFGLDRAAVEARHADLAEALRTHWPVSVVAYSCKTNYEVGRLCPAVRSWAEVVSAREYAMARAWGVPGHQIVFNGPHKTAAGLDRALDDGAIVHLDHPTELSRLLRRAALRASPAEVGLRLCITPSGRAPSRFGFGVESGEAFEAAAAIHAADGLQLTALHAHLGTDVDSAADHERGAEILGTFARTLRQRLGVTLSSIDTGGGFPARLKPYELATWNPRPLSEYIRTITRALRKTLPDGPLPCLIVEPGRSLVDDAMVMVTRVLNVRDVGGTQEVLVDATRAMLPMCAYHPLAPRAHGGDFRPLTGPRLPTRLLGSSCVEGDVLFEGRLPAMEPDRQIVFYSVGAYHQSMAGPFIYDTPPTVLL